MDLHERPVIFGEFTFTARQNAPAFDDSRWQVFADGVGGPVGFLEVRIDEDLGEERIFVFDPGNSPIGEESVGSYRNALSHLRARLIGIA